MNRVLIFVLSLVFLLPSCGTPEQQRDQLAILRESALLTITLMLNANKIDVQKHQELTVLVTGITDIAAMLTALRQVNALNAPPAIASPVPAAGGAPK